MKKTIITLVLLVACSTMSFGRLKVYTCPDGTTKFYVPIFESNGRGGSCWMDKGPAEREATHYFRFEIVMDYDYKHGNEKTHKEFYERINKEVIPLVEYNRESTLHALYNANVERIKRDMNYYITWEEFFKRICRLAHIIPMTTTDYNTGYTMSVIINWDIYGSMVFYCRGDEKKDSGRGYKKWFECGDNAMLLCYLRDEEYQRKYFGEGVPLIYQ